MTEKRVDILIQTNVKGSEGLRNLESGIAELGTTAGAAGAKTAGAAEQIGQLGAETKGLSSAANQAAGSVGQMGAAGERAEGQLGATRRGVQSISTQLEAMRQSMLAVSQAMGAAFSFRELVDAMAKMETVQAGFTAVTGSAAAAGQEMEFVRGVATRIGAEIPVVAQAFLGLSAATKGTAVEGEPTRQVFEAVATAMGKAGKTSAETQNALVALSQIASKGTVSMEELRGQLGEALPGALQAAANGLGVTTTDLIRLVEEGQIAASDLFPALTKGLNDLYGGAPSAQTLSQEIANIKNAFAEMSNNIGQAGGLDALKTGAEVAQTAIVLLDDAFVTVGQTIGAVAGAIATLNFDGLSEEFARIEQQSRDKLLKAAQHNETLARYIASAGNEATKAALAVQQQAAAAEKSGAAAAASAPQWVAVANAYGKVNKELTDSIALAERNVIARSAEARAVADMGAAFGTEQQAREAAAQAAGIEAAAQLELATQRQTQVNVLKAELEALLAVGAEQIKADPAKQKQIKDLQDLIEARAKDADKATEQAAASKVAQAAAQSEAETWRDNSGRVDELRAAYEKAAAELARLREMQRAGQATQQQVTDAEIAAGRAATLHRDALADQVKALEAKQRAQASGVGLEQAGLRLAMEQQRAIMEVARARGDEYTVQRAQNEIRRLEVQMLELVAQQKRAEAKSELAGIEAKKAALIASGQMTDAKRFELEAATNAARAKEIEAQVAELNAEKIKALAQANAEAADTAAQAAGGFDRAAAALQRYGDAAGTAGDQLRRVPGAPAGGGGQRPPAGGASGGPAMGGELTTLTGIVNFLRQAGVSDEATARQIALEFSDGRGNIPYFNNPGQRKYGGDTISYALMKAAETVTFGGAATGTNAQGMSPGKAPRPAGAASAPAPAPAPAASSGASTRTVNVNLSGIGTVSTDEAGSAVLQKLLSQLSAQKSRAL